MTIQKSATRSTGIPAGRTAYRLSFLREVHRLIAAGYARLTTSSLASEEETSITGQLVAKIREAIEGPNRLPWASRYAVHDDAPISSGLARGRDRPRIDIEVERTMPGAHPRLQFEAKRLHRSDSVAEYVGAEGLGAFLDGTYAAACDAAGMLGYVQADAEQTWASKIEAKLAANRRTHGIAKGAAVWEPFKEGATTLLAFRSAHARTNAAIDIYHTFLRCY